MNKWAFIIYFKFIYKLLIVYYFSLLFYLFFYFSFCLKKIISSECVSVICLGYKFFLKKSNFVKRIFLITYFFFFLSDWQWHLPDRIEKDINRKIVAIGNYPCETCGRRYTVKRSLIRHLKLECGKEPQFQCPYCPVRTTRNSTLKKHVTSQHLDKLYDYSTLNQCSSY